MSVKNNCLLLTSQLVSLIGQSHIKSQVIQESRRLVTHLAPRETQGQLGCQRSLTLKLKSKKTKEKLISFLFYTC